MNPFIKRFSMVVFPLVLTACGAEHVSIYDDGYYSDVYVEASSVHVMTDNHDKPELDDFYLVDSYGYSSEFSSSPGLTVDPYMDDGWFEVYWYTRAWDDYWVEFYVNDSPSITHASYVGSQLCGLGFECEDDGIQFCQYTAGFSLSCDTGEDQVTDVSSMMYTVPQTLYFIVQVCDLNFEYCEYSTEPVLFE
ncbi:hypothetical protein [Teredinibacter haidensis]|uniref:hypothetical protein n=1 Tax=Teredinibacter haidensis TaxID=2731755 RepID=UPI000948FCAC|nr:hypothetical protein [Teredinibacter haidensis]